MTTYRHGHAKREGQTPEYRAWRHMRGRCLDSRDKRFRYYGGRGISICERWGSFESFLVDMGPRPSSKHSLDRVDGDGNYGPSNCRWADTKMQSRNRKFARKISCDGEERCLGEWAEVVGIPYKTLHARVRGGWAIDRALKTPLDKRYSHPCGG